MPATVARSRRTLIAVSAIAVIGSTLVAGGGYWIWDEKKKSEAVATKLEEARLEQARQKELEAKRREEELQQRLKAETARAEAEKARVDAQARAAAEAQAKREAASRAAADSRAQEEARQAAQKAQRAAAEQRQGTSAPPPPQAQVGAYAMALEAVRRGDYRGAVAACKQAADAGEAQCQNLIGTFYAGGKVGNRSELEVRAGAELVRRAAQQGLPAAQFNLGEMTERGVGVRQDLGAAMNWYSKAASQGQPEAQRALQRLSSQGAAQAGGAVPSAQAAQRTAKELCAGQRNIITRSICESRECQKPEHQDETHCKQIKESGASRGPTPP